MSTNEVLYLSRDVRELTEALDKQQKQIDRLNAILHHNDIHEPSCTKGQQVLLPNMHYGYKILPCNCWIAHPVPF